MQILTPAAHSPHCHAPSQMKDGPSAWQSLSEAHSVGGQAAAHGAGPPGGTQVDCSCTSQSPSSRHWLAPRVWMLVEPWVPPVLVAPPELLTPASGLLLPPVLVAPPLPLVTPASWAFARIPLPSHEHVTSKPAARMMRSLATRKVWMRSRMSFSSMLGFETCASRRRSPKRGCLVNNSNYDATLLQPLQACQVLMMSGPLRQSLAFSMNRVTATSQISEDARM